MSSSNITLKIAEHAEEVASIMLDPELFDRMTEDGISQDDYELPFDGHQCYLIMLEDSNAIGVWNLYPLNTTTLNMHGYVLKQHRHHARTVVRLLYEWFVSECPKQYLKINAEIPETFKEVYNFIRLFGFRDEGVNRKSMMKNGVLVDQYRAGITKNEVFEFLTRKQKNKADEK